MKNSIQSTVVEVLFNNKPAKQYNHNGELFIEAKDGSEFEISIRNNNWFRVECVVGVDGLNVINGETNTNLSPGYIINPYDTLKIKGFRISDSEVAAFKFCKKGDSYASSKSVTGAQNGVITVQCYQEKPSFTTIPAIIFQDDIVWRKPTSPVPCTPTWTHNTLRDTTCGTKGYSSKACYEKYDRCLNNSVSNSLGSCLGADVSVQTFNCTITPSDHFDTGTAFGNAKESKVVHVTFERGDSIGEMNIYYASRSSLKELGVPLVTESKVTFPRGVQQYCVPPKGWKGA